MTTTTPPAPVPTPTPTPYRVTPARVLRAEWHKLWTLRSTWTSLILTVVLTLGTGLIIAYVYTPGDATELDSVLMVLIGMQFSQIIIGVLGILATAGEHSTGLVRSTMTAVPRRLPVLWSKAGIVAAVAFTTVLLTNFLTFSLARTFLTGTDQATSLGDPGVVTALVGNAAGLALLGVTALAIGSMVRSVPAAIGVLITTVMVLPEILAMLPYDVMDDIARHFPAKALEALTQADPAAGSAGPGAALLALALWAAAGLGAAALLLRRRDV
ncbi:ABC transporter permease [Streptomyces sp. NPDC088789]|uniref:ABC transporter permease n=1 Tax=Streptomyces sp. NPDC088789 TaxID=3365899 RepID=UPI00380D9A70